MDELRKILIDMGYDEEELLRAHIQLFIAYEGCTFGALLYVPPFVDRPQLFLRITDNLNAPALLEIYTDIETIKKITADEFFYFIGENGSTNFSESAPRELRTPENAALRFTCTRMLIQGFIADAHTKNITAKLIDSESI